MADDEDDRSERRRALSQALAWDDLLPLSASVKVQIGACSHPGKQSVNTDHYLVVRLGRNQETLATSLPNSDLPAPFDEHAYCMLVADGLNTSEAGAVASRVAISTLAHLAIHFGKWNIRVDAQTAAEITERAEWFYRRAHDAVVMRSRAHPVLSEMATTLTGAYSTGDELFIVHVGNSRAYLSRDGTLTQFSNDQTLAQRMKEGTGPMSVERPTADLRHILTDTVGGSTSEPRVQVEHVRLCNGDLVLLSTDGLTDVVDEDGIADVLALQRDPAEQCRMLVDLALRNGGQDNVTAVLAQYAIPTS